MSVTLPDEDEAPTVLISKMRHDLMPEDTARLGVTIEQA
jgi:hypothetical protein